jgi:hypothetical protein
MLLTEVQEVEEDFLLVLLLKRLTIGRRLHSILIDLL